MSEPREERRGVSWSGWQQKGTVYNAGGVPLRYGLCGDSGTVMLLCNGLWSGVDAWMPFVNHFQPKTRMLLWEYPGHGFPSGEACRGKASVRSFARDALELLDGVGIDQAVLVGQGMGVQIVLEMHLLCPERTACIVGLCGTDGGPFCGVVPFPLERAVSRAFQRILLPVGVPFWKLYRAVRHAYRPTSTGDPSFDRADSSPNRRGELWREKIHRTDPQTGLRIFSSMLFHPPARMLPQKSVPALILGGDQDRLISRERYRELANRLPGSRMVFLPGCTHRAMEENPEAVNRHVETFLRDHRMF
jgi:pimeloyl-ACP methyl ester carboxylesterase